MEKTLQAIKISLDKSDSEELQPHNGRSVQLVSDAGDKAMTIEAHKSATNIGIIGCGRVSEWYFEASKRIHVLNVVACADLRADRAHDKAEKYGVRCISTRDMLADPTIDLIINLTPPRAHFEVSAAVLASGKHLYTEKPLAINRDDGSKLLDLAKERGLRIGAAPDTFLGRAAQTCRHLIDEGAIGEPIAGIGFMLRSGVEHWHPDPAFLFQRGGGPLFDMGPYYLSMLVSLLGPVRTVSSIARTTYSKRCIAHSSNGGSTILVEVPTHVSGTLQFENGTIVTLVTSFDLWSSNVPFIEVHGTRGALNLPDPNQFEGPVRLRRGAAPEWREISLVDSTVEQIRGIGVAELAQAIQETREHRANAELAFHVLDTMVAMDESAERGIHVKVASTCSRPAPLPTNWLGSPQQVEDPIRPQDAQPE